MASPTSALDADALSRARDLLELPKHETATWKVLAAAGALALSALLFAAVMIAAPPVTSEHPGLSRSVE